MRNVRESQFYKKFDGYVGLWVSLGLSCLPYNFKRAVLVYEFCLSHLGKCLNDFDASLYLDEVSLFRSICIELYFFKKYFI